MVGGCKVRIRRGAGRGVGKEIFVCGAFLIFPLNVGVSSLDFQVCYFPFARKSPFLGRGRATLMVDYFSPLCEVFVFCWI